MELIKNARRTGLALVGVSAAVLGLALAPVSSTESIEAAINEARLLKSMDSKVLAGTLPAVSELHSENFTEPRVPLRFGFLVHDLKVENGGPLSLSPDLQVEVQEASDYRDDTLLKLRLKLLPGRRATLQDWLNYVDSPATFWFYPDKDSLQEAIRTAIPKGCSPCTLKTVSFTHGRELFAKPGDFIFRAILTFENDGTTTKERISFRGVTEDTEGTDDFQDLLRNAGKDRPYQELVGQHIMLPALRRYHHLVSVLPLDEAINALQNEAANSSPKLQVLGLSVDQRAAVLVAPGMVTMLLLYILAHIRELSSTFRTRKGQDLDASWVALFNDRLARVITIASLVVFPVFSCCILLVRVGRTVSGYYVATSIGLLVLAAVLGLWCVIALYGVRRDMFPSEPGTQRESTS